MASSNDMGIDEISASSLNIIDRKIQDYLRANAVLFNCVANYSAMAVAGASVVSIFRAGALTAAAKSQNTAATKQKITISADAINLNQHYQNVVALEDFARKQCGVGEDVLATHIFKEMVDSLKAQLEGALYTALAACSASGPDHRIAFTSPSTLAEADIREARRLLNVQNVPMEGRFLAVHPTQEDDLYGIDNFVKADSIGVGVSPRITGFIGRVMGFDVVMSTNVTENTVLMFQRDHVGVAIQAGIELRRDRAASEDFADDFSSQILYGVKTFDSGKRGVIIGTGS
jgi:hypothetical protein